MSATKPPSSHKVFTNLDDELNQIIEGVKIIKYWTSPFTIPCDTVKDIDWPAEEKARANQNFIQMKWATKWATEKILAGSEMENRGAWDNTKCPHKCGEELEEPEHVIVCPKANQLWIDIQQILLQWGAKNTAAPSLMASFAQGLHQWREGVNPSPLTKCQCY
eukprot:1691848-Ditylum_brightwellii.AAC.1